MRIIEKIKNVVTKLSLIALMIVLQNSFLTLDLQAKEMKYLDVVDTLKGLNSYYNVNSNLDLNKTKLVLVAPSKKITVLDKVRAVGSIDSDYLSEVGTYSLALGYKINTKYSVIETRKFEVTNSSFGIGGDLNVNLASEDRFKFVNAPDEVGSFANFSLTVQALNASGAVDVNYRGTIVFETGDENGEVPQEYTFLPGDAGVKAFNNAFTLSTLGEQTITVKDKDSEDLMSEITIEVVSAQNNNPLEGVIQVDSPTPGTVTNNQVTFVGTADAGLEVQLLDSGVFLDQINAGADGKFVLTTDPLPDGDYIFSLKTSNAVSEPIAIKIVSSATKVSSVVLDPVTPVAGSNVQITITFESPADVASAIINGTRISLQPVDGAKTVFRGTFIAPSEVNEYPINVDVTNALGVKAVLEQVAKFNVMLGSASEGIDGITFNVPSQVVGVVAVSGDQRVTLNWNEASALKGISNYRIYYGTNSANLDLNVDTNSAATSWFVPGLENGVRYYFQVYGVDTEGNESDQPSVMLSVVPGVDGSTTLHGSADGQVLVNGTSETGPEIYLLVVFSLLVAAGYRKLSA